MLVKFEEGPLDGQERTIPDEIEEGAVIDLPSGIPRMAERLGDETALSYLYVSEGIARYIWVSPL